MRTIRTPVLVGFFLLTPWAAARQSPQKPAASPTQVAAQLHPSEGDFIAHDFRFGTGETLPELRLHYTTLGRPARDAAGRVTNAVMFLHGTGGSGRGFLTPQFAGVLFGSGELLDASRYFIILPDGIGHGHSSKPSDRMRMRFPRYDYADMVRAQHLLLIDGLHVNHLRLVGGTSMGCMHSWLWAETYPDFMDAALPLACLPVQIAGRNRMMRTMIIDSIRNDPAWDGGDYRTEPLCGLRGALGLLFVMISSPLQEQKQFPTAPAADRYIDGFLSTRLASTDANDMLYAFDASRTYDPSARLGAITTWVMAINSADDFVNPPELRIAETEIGKVKHGRFVLLPISDATRGHTTHSLPAVWHSYLEELLRESAR
ncbi:MAG TPA: alpha/beta fold hydrolase [Candidatus Acidoferrales bacterium]|nr:alpha/beta fold hydrolase [Candidatus Acidoferrales bacterium]